MVGWALFRVSRLFFPSCFWTLVRWTCHHLLISLCSKGCISRYGFSLSFFLSLSFSSCSYDMLATGRKINIRCRTLISRRISMICMIPPSGDLSRTPWSSRKLTLSVISISWNQVLVLLAVKYDLYALHVLLAQMLEVFHETCLVNC